MGSPTWQKCSSALVNSWWEPPYPPPPSPPLLMHNFGKLEMYVQDWRELFFTPVVHFRALRLWSWPIVRISSRCKKVRAQFVFLPFYGVKVKMVPWFQMILLWPVMFEFSKKRVKCTSLRNNGINTWPYISDLARSICCRIRAWKYSSMYSSINALHVVA